MAGRGTNESFADGLVRLIQEIARVKVAPDAHLDFLNQLEGIILDYLNSQTPSPGGPNPAQEQMSRGPAPNPDMSGVGADILAQMGAAPAPAA
jgi:hypothetical protein